MPLEPPMALSSYRTVDEISACLGDIAVPAAQLPFYYVTHDDSYRVNTVIETEVSISPLKNRQNTSRRYLMLCSRSSLPGILMERGVLL